MRLGIATCTRGTESDYCLSGVHRLLTSLYASDMPKDTIVCIAWAQETPHQPTLNIKNGRRQAIVQAMVNTDAVLMIDDDVTVPSVWWRVMKPLLSESEVGVVVPDWIGNKNVPAEGWKDYYFEDTWFRGQEACVLFKKEFLEDGLKDDPILSKPSERFYGFPLSLQRIEGCDEVHKTCTHQTPTCPKNGGLIATDARRWKSVFVPQVRFEHNYRYKF